MSSGTPTWKRLISDSLSTEERVSLITSLFSDHDEAKAVEYLSGDDAQTFIDVIDEASLHLRIVGPVSVDSQSNVCVLSVRSWKVSHRGHAGGVCARYTRFVAAKPCFHDH